MLSLLVRKQMAEIFRSYFYNPKTNKKRAKGAVIAYIVLFVLLMVGVLGGIFAFLAYSICAPFLAVDMGWLYFVLMTLLAVFLGTFGSVFNTFSGLYLAKDNDLLLSMPIPVRTVMASRLLGVYLMGLMYSAAIMLPTLIVYWIVAPLTVGGIVGPILLLVLTSIFVLTLSCALGWVVAKISLKLKNKSFLTVFASLVFLAAYYFVYFKAQTVIQDLVLNASAYGAKIKGAAYPLYLIGKAGTGDGAAMLLVSAAVLGLFALTWWALSRSFLKLATSSGKTERIVYREKAVKAKSPASALLGKEFARFTGSANYMLNCGLGVLFLPVIGVLLLIKGGDFLPMLDAIFGDRPGCSAALTAAALCMAASMIDPAAPSVSLEGKSLWLVQSLPVTPWQVLRAKLRVQLLLAGIPMAVGAVCVLFVLPCTVLELVLLVVTLGVYVLLSALFNLAIGLKLPNLNWTSEITPIKQGGSVMLALFGSWIYSIALGVLYLIFGLRLGLAAYLGIFSAVSAVLCLGLYLWLKGRGSRIFASL